MNRLTLTVRDSDEDTEIVVDLASPLKRLDRIRLTTTFLRFVHDTVGDEGEVRVRDRVGAEELCVAAVIEAARKIKRGCDCEYDHRCGRCEDVVSLQGKLEALDKARTS